MAAVTALAQPTPLNLGINVDPGTLKLFDGSELTISSHVPLTAAARRNAVISSGQIYFYGGRIDETGGYLGGYLGQSADLESDRAATSLTKWIVSQRRIIPAGMALLRRDEPFEDDYRRYIEAKAIMRISTAGIWMLNTQTGAGIASHRLTRAQVHSGEHLANSIGDAILTHLFGGLVNKHPSPAANTREAAVRMVIHSPEGLDVFDIMRRLHASGVTSAGRTFAFSLRRDLHSRDRQTRGVPRVVSTSHRGRRVFWNPLTLTKTQALRTYDARHPQ